MKKIGLSFLLLSLGLAAEAQIIPSFDFGLKAGLNFSKLEENGIRSENRSGALYGVWGRVGAMGLHFQPELYYSIKKTEVTDANGQRGIVEFTSFDLPLLLGTKIGAVGLGARLHTGPVISFVISEDQSFNDALSNAARFRFKNQALAWQVGIGADVKRISVDARYEHGLSAISRTGYSDTKLRLFNVSLGYRLF